MLFFIAVKKYIEAYHIICSLCSPTHLESNTIGFFILRFFCDLLWFSKTALGDNLTGFEKFRGWYRPFHKLGGYVVHPKELRGWYRLFPIIYNHSWYFRDKRSVHEIKSDKLTPLGTKEKSTTHPWACSRCWSKVIWLPDTE